MPKRILKGKVVSAKNNKTIVVMVSRKYKHPQFKKIMNSSRNFHAHDEENKFKIGDVVRIQESRPISKKKHWKVLEG